MARQNLGGDRVSVHIGVCLSDRVFDQLTGCLVFHALNDPATLAPDASPTNVEHLHRGFQLFCVETKDVGVRVLREHHGVLIQHGF